MVRVETTHGTPLIQVVHDGPHLHHQVPEGKQCRCGMIPNLGVRGREPRVLSAWKVVRVGC
jgi:hypothetical protein